MLPSLNKGIVYYYLFIYGACVDNFSVLFSYTALLYIPRYSVRPEKTHHLCLPSLPFKILEVPSLSRENLLFINSTAHSV